MNAIARELTKHKEVYAELKLMRQEAWDRGDAEAFSKTTVRLTETCNIIMTLEGEQKPLSLEASDYKEAALRWKKAFEEVTEELMIANKLLGTIYKLAKVE